MGVRDQTKDQSEDKDKITTCGRRPATLSIRGNDALEVREEDLYDLDLSQHK